MRTSYCMHGQHFVREEEITKLWTGKVWKRMCEKCKSDAIDRKREERERKAREAASAKREVQP